MKTIEGCSYIVRPLSMRTNNVKAADTVAGIQFCQKKRNPPYLFYFILLLLYIYIYIYIYIYVQVNKVTSYYATIPWQFQGAVMTLNFERCERFQALT